MPAKAAILVGLALLACHGDAGAQEAAVPAITARPVDVEGAAWYDVAKRQRDRVRLLKGYVCADPGTARVAPADIEQAMKQVPAAKTPGYVLASRTFTAPTASYPADQLAAGNPGAALVMITIRADGDVADARVVCATGDDFALRARETALQNRYGAARLNEVPVPSVVFQTVTYGVSED